jgi:hypothetical protein
MNAYGKVKIQLHAFLTSATDGGEWSASCPLGKESPVPTEEDAMWTPELAWLL